MNRVKKLSDKTNFVLKIIIFIFLFILFRVWHLTFIQKEELTKTAKHPQRRSIIEHANRGTIYDRYGKPIALNRIRYNAAIYYTHIKQIPSIRWKKNENNRKVKTYPKKEYINKLSHVLAEELEMDPILVEDLIYSRASLLPHAPFVIKENISEKQYYRLRMLEKKYTGLHAELSSERYYPHKSVGSDILGYLGSINRCEYMKIAKEIAILENYKKEAENGAPPPLIQGYANEEDLYNRLSQLKEMAYTINDLVGKCGIEESYEEKLRGYYGKKIFEVDFNGKFLKELPSSKRSVAGENITTTISLELQEYAEALLAEDEKCRDGASKVYDSSKKVSVEQKQPLIKGGAIVAMEPNTGEILALASYPRFDPNDFIPSSNITIKKQKQKNINKWLETSEHIANIWDNKTPITRELYSAKKRSFHYEKNNLSWDYFLSLILPSNKDMYNLILKMGNIKNAIALQEDIEELMFLLQQKEASKIFDIIFPEMEGHVISHKNIVAEENEELFNNLAHHNVRITEIKSNILKHLSSIKNNKDKLFIIDLCKTVVNSPSFSDNIIEKIGYVKISDYWDISKAFINIEEIVESKIHQIYKNTTFKRWREKHQKSYLLQKRKKEKKDKVFAKPYLDYIEEVENKKFKSFWKKYRLSFLSYIFSNDKILPNNAKTSNYYQYLSSDTFYNELHHLTYYSYLKEALSSYDDTTLVDLIRTVRSYKELDRKLFCIYPFLRKNNNIQLEKHLASSFYPITGNGYGRSYAFRQNAPLGSTFKLVTSYAALKQRYHDLSQTNVNDTTLNPFVMIDQIRWDNRASKKGGIVVGYNINNKPYPLYYKKGRLPKSSYPNIGLIDLPSALETSSNPYFAILAGDYLTAPEDLLSATRDFSFGTTTHLPIIGEIKGNLPNDLNTNRTGLYSFAIGQHSLVVTPVQVAVMLSSIANGGYILQPQLLQTSDDSEIKIQSTIFMPSSIRNMLLDGMHRVMIGVKGHARPSVIRKLWQNKDLKKLYNSLKHQLIGKTSTAEIMYNPDVTPSSQAKKYKHLWFTAITFKNDPSIYNLEDMPKSKLWQNPELIIVVYLQFGDAGKEAAPIAAQIAQKYRDITQKYNDVKDTQEIIDTPLSDTIAL
jgi:cell division protein FtsI/penicillin-binding protein 2